MVHFLTVSSLSTTSLMRAPLGPWCVAIGFCSSSICRSTVIDRGSRSSVLPKLLASSSTSSRTSSVREIQEDLRLKRRSAVEITKEWLDKLKSREEALGSFITIAEDHAIAQAESIDKTIQSGFVDSLGSLAGVPIAVKDNICTKGITTTAGSAVLKNYVPPYNAFAVDKLRESGAIMVGKTNLDEFGMGSSTENSAFKVTHNPWSLDRVPGGSSGGSAAAVAGNQCVSALGSDTGGSIRLPAHFCGIVGLKPTYGRVSRHGLIAYGSSLDCIGSMAGCVEDAALVLHAISGLDEHDSTSSSLPVPDFAGNLNDSSQLESRPLEGKRIAIISETLGAGVDSGVLKCFKEAAAHFEELGAVVEEVSISSFAASLPAYYVLAVSEASSNLSRYDGVRYGVRQSSSDLRDMYSSTRMSGLGDEVKRRIIMGTYALSAGYYDAYYKRAQQVRTIVRQELRDAFLSYDALMCPAAPTPAYKIGEVVSDPLAMYKGDLMLVGCNLAGHPGIVLPCGTVDEGDEKLPVGLQLVGKLFGEQDIIDIAHTFEQTIPFIGTPNLT